MRNSRIILCKNIKLDREYNHVLNYTEEQMVALCRSNAIAEKNDYSFIRGSQNIKTNFAYEDCLKANYIAFQNYDYSNKWFFAWIDDVIYKADKTAELSFTIDIFSTWFTKLQINDCFVVREHVNNDTIGANTVPEDLDVGEVVCERQGEFLPSGADSIYFIVESTYNPRLRQDFSEVSINTGNLAGSMLFAFKGDNNARGKISNFIRIINEDGKIESVRNMYILPAFLVDMIGLVDESITRDGMTYSASSLLFSNSAKTIDVSAYVPSSFNGVSVKNKKCFTYPYNYMLVSNNVGNQAIYKYENFAQQYDSAIGENEFGFRIEMAVSVGGSVRLVPKGYKGESLNYDESLPLAKFPTCSWSSDAFINWLTKNAINIGTSIASTFAGVGITLASGGAGAVAGASLMISGSIQTAGIIGQFRDATLKPSIVGGNNSADVNFSTNKNSFSVYQMRVKNEYLQIIDNYFTKYGYKVNAIKHPNLSGRSVFNYVEIGQNEVIGFGEIPAKALELINNTFRKGVTIWHNHQNIGNYYLNNNII